MQQRIARRTDRRPRAAGGPAQQRAHPVLDLQRAAGNRATMRLLGAAAESPVQRWRQPQEDRSGNKLLDFLDKQEVLANKLLTGANALAARVPASLKREWAGRITGYQRASDIRNDIQTATTNARTTKTLAELQKAKDDANGDILTLGADFYGFKAEYDKLEVDVQEQADRYDVISNALAQPQGAVQLGRWRTLATAIENMNQASLGPALNAFRGAEAGAFGAADVAAARLLPATDPRKEAAIEYVTDLFATGRTKLSTWGKYYPTNWDLKTGEFGAEWHIKSPAANWLNGTWVFHAHCKSIINSSGQYEGFQFAPALGANHIKMYEERLQTGVALDLPLTVPTLRAMAAPYQDAFLERVVSDGAFREVLKKSR